MKSMTYPKWLGVKWDGQSPLYSYSRETYYDSLEDAESDLELDETIEDLQLMPCVPFYARPVEYEYWEDELEDGSELPKELQEKIDQFNKDIKNIMLCWLPEHKRIIIS